MQEIRQQASLQTHAHLCVCARHVVLLRASPGAAPLQLVSDQALVAVCIEGDGTHNQVQASLISSKEAHGKDLYNADSTCHCSISNQACVRATKWEFSLKTANFAVSGRVCSLYDGQQDQEFMMQIKGCTLSGNKAACGYMRVHKAR